MDESKKVFRGNLDFKTGAKRSKGIEEEYVILLDPNVKSDSLPALMCDEDDVQGEHAASAGQIDKNKLFYLMTRGLSEREAKKLIVEAQFKPIIDNIPIENLRNIINSEISRRLTNA
jgi:Fe-S cluster assembly scaffold protein SufB